MFLYVILHYVNTCIGKYSLSHSHILLVRKIIFKEEAQYSLFCLYTEI